MFIRFHTNIQSSATHPCMAITNTTHTHIHGAKKLASILGTAACCCDKVQVDRILTLDVEGCEGSGVTWAAILETKLSQFKDNAFGFRTIRNGLLLGLSRFMRSALMREIELRC